MSNSAPQLPIKVFKNPDTVKSCFQPRPGIVNSWPSSLSFLETPRGKLTRVTACRWCLFRSNSTDEPSVRYESAVIHSLKGLLDVTAGGGQCSRSTFFWLGGGELAATVVNAST
jgi:hypothetical protein